VNAEQISPFPIAQPSPTTTPSSRGFPPCSTLFVGNLGAGTNEKELEDLFRSFPGFERLKVSRKDHSVMCFAEFQNVQCSTHAMNSLQGVTLQSSDKGGIRIEYARNRMGESNGGHGF